MKKKISQVFNIYNTKKEKGFIILISVVVSSLLVSMGIFISNVAYKELLLSTSTKSSHAAFYLTESVMECALRADIRGDIFGEAENLARSENIEFMCNGRVFTGVNTGDNPKVEYPCAHDINNESTCYSGKFIYYISFAESGLDPDTGQVDLPASEAVQDAPYVKVVFHKSNIGDLGLLLDNGTRDESTMDATVIEVFGRNKYSGTGLVERALEARL